METNKRPKSLNFAEAAELCLRHMTGNYDADHDYVPYVGVTLGEKRPHFVHHRLDWSEVIPYAIYGEICARDLCGSQEGAEIEKKQRELFLRQISPLDFLIHSSSSPWNKAYEMCLWEQSRALHALLYWYMEERDERLAHIMQKMVATLFDLSHQTGNQRTFAPELVRSIGMGPIALGEIIDPLLKYYELFGDEKARMLGVGLAYYCVDASTGFFDENGDVAGNQLYRSGISVLSGVLRAARLTQDAALFARGKQNHDRLSSYVTGYGATPCTEPACSNMELIYSAIHLAETVDPSYYEQIDRYVRNQTTEAQFLTKNEWKRELAHEGRMTGEEFRWVFGEYPDTLDILPYDYYGEDADDVLDKSEGGFLWTDFSEHRFVPASLMLCCSGHAMRSFHLVAEKMIRPTIRGFDVNFHYSFENEYAELISYEPFEGKFTVIPQKDRQEIRVRIPAYWDKEQLRVCAERGEIQAKTEGNYVVIRNAEKGQEIQLLYPLESHITEENVFRLVDHVPCLQFKVRVEWRGNTVMRLLDHCSDNPKMIYKHRSKDAIYGGKPMKISGRINW